MKSGGVTKEWGKEGKQNTNGYSNKGPGSDGGHGSLRLVEREEHAHT